MFQEDKKSKGGNTISMKEVKDAIEEFAIHARKGITLQALTNDDNSINYSLLDPYLSGIPDQQYYMSKETYEVFGEKEKALSKEIDLIQRAVDQYVKIKGVLPIIDEDPYRKVNYFKLEALGLIKNRPSTNYYISELENLITRQQPR